MQVGLVENDDRPGATFPSDSKKSFDAAKIVVFIEGADQEHGVDVRCDDLFGAALLISGRTAGEFGSARENGVDVSAPFVRPIGNRNPVAYGW